MKGSRNDLLPLTLPVVSLDTKDHNAMRCDESKAKGNRIVEAIPFRQMHKRSPVLVPGNGRMCWVRAFVPA